MRILVLLICCLLSSCLTPFLPAFSQNENKDEIYKDSFREDIPRSMQGIPYEDEQYLGEHYSPYILVRIPKPCKIDKERLSSGYYLVKIFSENDVDYILFKKNASAVALMPVLSKEMLQKKVKKAKYEISEDGHGKYFVLTVKQGIHQYTTRLEITS